MILDHPGSISVSTGAKWLACYPYNTINRHHNLQIKAETGNFSDTLPVSPTVIKVGAAVLKDRVSNIAATNNPATAERKKYILEFELVSHTRCPCATICPSLFCGKNPVAGGIADRKQGLEGTNLYADGDIFLQPLHRAIYIYFRMIKLK